jgi:hypothetical protein
VNDHLLCALGMGRFRFGEQNGIRTSGLVLPLDLRPSRTLSRSDSGASLDGPFAAGFGAASVDASKCFDCRIQSRQLVLHMITFFFQLPDNP